MPVRAETKRVQSENPRTGKAVGYFTPTLTSEMPAIISRSRSAFDDWSILKLDTRIDLLRKTYRELYENAGEVAQLISDETGKPLLEAYSSEILPVLDCFKYYLKNIKNFLRTTAIPAFNPLLKLRKGFVRWEPVGVVAIISPWNFPFLLSMQHIIPALLSGNVVIHKPSEYTTLTGLKIQELFDRANLPRNIFSIVAGFSDVGQALVNSNVDKIFFTGSTKVGQRIYEAAARNLTPVNMELGGSDPMIVLNDCNLERTVGAAVWGAFSNAGQACVSVERLFVQDSIFDEFVKQFAEKASRLRLNPGLTNECDISCLVNESQFQKIDNLIQDAKSEGAVLYLSGQARKDIGNLFYEPTIISKTEGLVKEEIFGPVVLVAPFTSDGEAIKLANESEFGLSASIWSQDHKRALTIANRVQSGSVLINELQSQIAQFEVPYTGYKKSGLGINHGPWGMLEMVQPKYISVDRSLLLRTLAVAIPTLKKRNVWWFPYNKERLTDFHAFIQLLHDRSVWRRLCVLPSILRAFLRKEHWSE